MWRSRTLRRGFLPRALAVCRPDSCQQAGNVIAMLASRPGRYKYPLGSSLRLHPHLLPPTTTISSPLPHGARQSPPSESTLYYQDRAPTAGAVRGWQEPLASSTTRRCTSVSPSRAWPLSSAGFPYRPVGGTGPERRAMSPVSSPLSSRDDLCADRRAGRAAANKGRLTGRRALPLGHRQEPRTTTGTGRRQQELYAAGRSR